MTKLHVSLAGLSLGLLGCGWSPENTAEELFRELPSDQAVLAYLDVSRLPQSGTRLQLPKESFAGLESLARVAEVLNLDLRADLEAAAFSVGEGVVTLAIAGELPKTQLRAALAEQGADCETDPPDGLCVLQTGRGEVWVFFPGSRKLVVVSAPDAAAITALRESREPEYRAYASEAMQSPEAAFVWGIIRPRKLAEIMQDPPQGWVNLSLLARALEKSQRARFALESVGESLRFRVVAECATPEEAIEQKGLLAGLSRFVAAAIDASSGRKGSNEWSRILRSGQFAHAGSDAVASWSIDATVLFQPKPH